MKSWRRIAALLLCVAMLVPSQGMTTWADTVKIEEGNLLELIETDIVEETVEPGETQERVEETLPLSPIAPGETQERVEETLPLDPIAPGETQDRVEETLPLDPVVPEETQDRVEETLPLQPVTKPEVEDAWNGEAIIYWNPSGELWPEAASPSDASPSDASPFDAATTDVGKGNDRANGLTPKTPVKSLETALKRAQKLQDEEGVPPSEITIYAMSPMEIEDGEFYLLNGSDVELASWPGRAYDNDTIFYLNGGQLALTNIRLDSRDPEDNKQDAELVRIHGGALQLGQSVEIKGSITMNYCAEKENTLWDEASSSDADDFEASSSDAAAFDISEYMLSEKSAPMELQRESASESTWREPIIELLNGFEGVEEKYWLEVLGDSSTMEVQLVKTLYADEESEEEFKNFFSLAGSEDEEWELVAESQPTTHRKDTGVTDLTEFRSMNPIEEAESLEPDGAENLTVKTLSASRAASTVIFWNPGPAITIDGIRYNAGSDESHSGLAETAPLKTLTKAVAAANGGTVYCMQSVDLGQHPEEYLGVPQADGSYLVKSPSPETMVTLKLWEPQLKPAFIVPAGETLVLQDIVLAGLLKDGRTQNSQVVLVNGGDVVIESRVTAETGYIQMNASAELRNHPLTMNSDLGGLITLFFGGINDNLSHRYTDVVVPGGALAAQAIDADAMGRVLASRVQVEASNRDEEHGGKSKFDWSLRQDTGEDDGVVTAQNLELYAGYYYEFVFLNGVSGDDAGFGATCQYPVKTWESAIDIWTVEMAKSIAARTQAKADGKDTAYINEKFPLPKTIYLCGTVTVSDTRTWELPGKTDYDGSRIITEIVSHTHAADRDDGTGKVHESPKTLIQVTTGGNLTLADVPIRNITDEADSVTVLVEANAELTLTGTSQMTGERKKEGATASKAVTLGTHIKGTAESRIKLPDTWTGVIEKRQHGVEADGVGTTLTMGGGTIQKNNSFDATRRGESGYVPIKGAGVVLSGGATFVMEGGKISENEVYQYGAGVCMEGAGTTFDMKAGEISDNKMTRFAIHTSSSIAVQGYGTGVYAGQETRLTIGLNGGANPSAAKIVRNSGYLVWGAGVYSDGVVILNQGSISENIGNPSEGSKSINYICKGLGIYISSTGLFQMENGEISNNKTKVRSTSDYESCLGAGLYLGASQQANYIHGGVISENWIGKGYSDNEQYASGGGIYLEGRLEVKHAEIKKNRASYGAGIFVKGSSFASLTIEDSVISENIARHASNTDTNNLASGRGGGICGVSIYGADQYNIVLKEGVEINRNQADYGGGIYLDGRKAGVPTITNARVNLRLQGTAGKPVKINNNNNSGSGGGIYTVSGASISGSYAEIVGNQSRSSGGGMYLAYTIAVLSDITISGNTAGSGGGICTSADNKLYFSDMTITQNQATREGGGMYLLGSQLYLTETGPGKSSLSGNTASRGGGIYGATFSDPVSTMVWNLSGSMQNSATEQGANLYLTNIRVQLLNGRFQQPEEPVAGVYNVYVNASTEAGLLSIDMTKVAIEKKIGQSPDAIYLNTANSYLTYLQTPVSTAREEFPIDLNTEAFKVGSIVIKPGNVSQVTVLEPNADCTGTVSRSIAIAKATDATVQLEYSSGGTLPRRMQLGGLRDSQTAISNAVLVGEGIYLSSAGSDNNSGLSPDQAVATFDQAKVKLEEQIVWHDANGTEGFSPFIYICGSVLVSENATWELDYEDALFTTTNADYKTAEEALGETAYPAQVRRFTSFVNEPMIGVGRGGPSTEFRAGKIIINGLAEAVITSSQGMNSPIIDIRSNSVVTLTGYSKLTNNFGNGIRMYGARGTLVLEGTEDEPNEQLLDINGESVTVLGAGATVEMKGYSRIVSKSGSENNPKSRTAINSSASDAHILMMDHSRIMSEGTAIGIKFGAGIQSNGRNTKIEMQNEAYIGANNSITGMDNQFVMRDSAGIYAESGIILRNSVLSMEDMSWIKTLRGGTGVKLMDGGQIQMNKNMDAKESDSAWIEGGSGITVAGAGTGIFMGKRAELRNNVTAGIHFQSYSDGSSPILIEMSDESKITKGGQGIFLTGSNVSGPVQITMKGESAIEACKDNGIYEEGYNSSYGFKKLSLTMEDNSRISGNGQNGILIQGGNNTADHQITMRDSAVIGGRSGNYEANTPVSGNKYSGIRANSPMVLDMSGSSQIAWNGGPHYTDASRSSGLYLERTYYNGLFRSGEGSIVLRDQASISSNGRGIFLQNLNSSALDNSYRIALDGTNGGTPSIQANKSGVRVNKESVLELKGSAFLGQPTVVEEAYALDCYGKLVLDGRSTVEGQIYLREGSNPITMTHKAEDVLRRYRLYLAEGFVGKVVVQPDDPNSLSGGIQDVTDQFSYFIKDGGEGLAEVRPLIQSTPNIILGGENNVYLSGSGNDANDGGSPGTAVQTFKRAKELLRTGYFTSGANILISENVPVRRGDEDWSFETGGFLTNINTRDTWMPKVIRDKAHTMGPMITVTNMSSSLAETVTFEHITIDGGSEEGIVLDATYVSLMEIYGSGRNVTLGEGAIIQNQKVVSDGLSSSVAILVEGGTLEIDGGIIRGMTRTITTDTDFLGSSSIHCRGTDSKVLMRSGQIMGNSVTSEDGWGGVVTITDGGEFLMSGGTISGNVMTGNTKGAALYVENAKATIEGGVIRGNKGRVGSAIYYTGSGSSDINGVILSGGQIIGNTTDQDLTAPAGVNSPIYVGGTNFQLKGGGTLIQDNIYLDSTENIIKVSGNIYQIGRLYNIYLNQDNGSTPFRKGSVVVRPDGNWMTDVTPFLQYFRVKSNPYVLDRGQVSRDISGGNGIKESQTLLLMQAVYLDSINGSDTDNDGLTPWKAVHTFTKAKDVGEKGSGGPEVENYYIIYVSGKAINTTSEQIWSLPQPAYMCRYTGFSVYNKDGSEAMEEKRHYYGTLIEPESDLILGDIAIYGRRSNDTATANGESLMRVIEGVTVQVSGNTVLGRNLNMGPSVDYEHGLPSTLSSKGGAVYVEPGGVLDMQGGSILETDAAYGSAIYQAADAATPNKFGRLNLSGSPLISGKTYLSGINGGASAYIEPDDSYMPTSPLGISIEDDYTGRSLVRYRGETIPGADEYKYYVFEDGIQAIYDIVNREQEPAMMELQLRRAIYLDGQRGSDGVADGRTPETAFRTLKETYEAIGNVAGQKGVLVFVVDTVDLTNGPSSIQLNNILIDSLNGDSHYEGFYTDDEGTQIAIQGQVYFKRYVQPDGYKDDPESSVYAGYGKKSNENALFQVTSEKKLTLSGIYLDGHSRDSDGSVPVLQAKGVEALSPLITVEEGGELICSRADKTNIANGIDTATLLTNNTNKKVKDNVVGQLGGMDILEGSGAGIEIRGGKVTLKSTEFKNLKLGDEVIAGGTDIYQNGELHFSTATWFSGSVYLEGQGTLNDEASHTSSRYLKVDVYGRPAATDFQVLMRDSYKGRTIVEYLPGGDGPGIAESATYRLEERVKDFFCLTERAGAPYIFELQVPSGIYIDGINGVDELTDPDSGSTPSAPVKTLRRAFELMKTRTGKTIYVVGTIQLENTVHVTGNSYKDSQVNINLGSTDRVEITRYIQPDYAVADSVAAARDGYDVGDFTGPLLNIKNGATASFGQNVFFDGHSEPRTGPEYLKETVVTRTSEAKGALITVAQGGTLNLLSGTTLQDNNNTLLEDENGFDGGVLYNSGTTTVDGALFTNNKAKKGSAVYQSGTFTIASEPEKLAEHTFYLTSANDVDRVIQTSVKIPDGQVFEVELEHPVTTGRDVVRFMDSSAYDPNADAENVHFRLGTGVPEEMFLVQAKTDENVLEVQNWEVLDVEIPRNIYLVMQRRGSYNSTITLNDIRTDAQDEELLTSPEYTITNRGIHDVKVSISEFANKSTEAGILPDIHPLMTLTATAEEAVGETDLYLAVKGLDSERGFTMAETSLKPYAETTVLASPLLLGSLGPSETGKFTFNGAAGGDFIEKYKDSTFPIEGETKEEVQAYMDGTSSTSIVNASAKYDLKYKIEINPPRR